MPSYLLSFRTPNDYAATPDTRVAWNKFFGEISTHLEDIGSPIFSGPQPTRLDVVEDASIKSRGW